MTTIAVHVDLVHTDAQELIDAGFGWQVAYSDSDKQNLPLCVCMTKEDAEMIAESLSKRPPVAGEAQMDRIHVATTVLAAVASEIEFNGQATLHEAETFGLVSAALMALNRALGVNGQERVSW